MRQTLDIGCGAAPRSVPGAEAWGIDYRPGLETGKMHRFVHYATDLNIEPIPWRNDCFERVFAHDFLEHVPRILYLPDRTGKLIRRYPLIELFNEVWRVLTPGGVFETVTPALPDLVTWSGDPTHVSLWSENCFNYYCAWPDRNFEWELMRAYGYRARFQKLRIERAHGGGHLLVEMAAVKE